MDKSAIKNFAIGARVKLIEQIKQKAYTFGITKDGIKKVEMFEDAFEVNGNKYNKKLLKHRESLERKINEKGFEQVIEEVAYTWFNRLIAIRFMEVNEYLPSGVRVLSSTDSIKVEPDIIREATNLDFENLNIDLIYKLHDENNTEELFKYLLIKQCNELGKIMPVVFEEIEDYSELLLPDNLLQEGSIVRDIVTSINEEDWKEQVEIIGWLYQYYISEKKDEVFADLKKNIKITKENIPAATQLFTPDWIVKYMVENSLGRLWLESHPNEELKAKWKYYLEEAEQETEVQKQLKGIREKNKDLKPEDIKVIDPCMGSGHILVYKFDILYDIYKSAGYSEREIPKLILTNNLYGLDIDDRASQLSYFAVMMKARSYNRRIFREKIDLNICSIQESNDFPKEAIDFLVNTKETEIEKGIHRDEVEYLINVFNDAKEYGSILEVKEIDFEAIERRVEEIKTGEITDIFEWKYINIILEKIPALIKQAKIMSQKYDVVCTNPPYMGNLSMSIKLKKYLNQNYTDSKQDLFAAFIEKGFSLVNEFGFNVMVTMQGWMFLSSFETMRKKILQTKSIYTLLNMDNMVMGIAFGTCATIFRNTPIAKYNGRYIRISLSDLNEDNIPWEFPIKNNKYRVSNTLRFMSIPGSPIAYWISDNYINIFKNFKQLSEFAEPKTGIQTGNNTMFLRFWFEVNYKRIGLSMREYDDIFRYNHKWFPYNKGGAFRKWYGNNEYVVDMENGGQNIKTKMINYRLRDSKYYFKELITWSFITSGTFNTRYCPNGFLCDVAGSSIYPNKEDIWYLTGLSNSKVVLNLLDIQNPTLNFQVENISRIPTKFVEDKIIREKVNHLVQQNIEITKTDWNNFETSWEFSSHPLLINKEKNLMRSFEIMEKVSLNQFQQLKENEEELNRLFINIYGLNDELSPNVDSRDICIEKYNSKSAIRSLISYALGCMFGRYSLDQQGLVYAGGDFNLENYNTFKADFDNVIPITDDEYFEDDIVSRFVEFIKITFSEETLEENLDYIADTLGKKGNETSRQTVRRYFLKDFYKDHLQTYKKRPIYWLFDSGKNDGFKALVYMHRYDIGTVARVRTDYLHLLQRKYEAEVNRLDMVMENSNASERENTEARKKKEKIQKQIIECVQYDQIIAHVANQKITIDLDDGVSVNYSRFQGVEVPQGEGKKSLKADLLGKI